MRNTRWLLGYWSLDYICAPKYAPMLELLPRRILHYSSGYLDLNPQSTLLQLQGWASTVPRLTQMKSN
jgi:hypothetical protein